MMMFTDTSRGVNIAKDPAVVFFNNKYYMYYSISPGKTALTWDIGIACSLDLENWTKLGQIERTEAYESNGICAPGAITIGDQVHLFYQTYGNGPKDAICHAYSTDGENFIRNETNPIIRCEGTWNNGRGIDADVVLFNGELYLYYATRDPEGKKQLLTGAKTQLQNGFPGNSWTQLGSNALLRPELDWEQDCIEAPATIVRDGCIYLFYGGAYNNYPQQIGLAYSSDGINFKRYSNEPFIKNGSPGSWNSSESGHPYIFETPDRRIFLFYQGNNDHGHSWYLSKVELSFSNGSWSIKD